MASSTHPPNQPSTIVADLMPSNFSFQHLGLGRGFRTLRQEWPFILKTVESILDKNFDTCLHSTIHLLGLGSSRVHAGGPKIVLISMMRESDMSEWPEVAEEIQDFLDTINYGVQVRMEYDGEKGLAIPRQPRPLTRQQLRLQDRRW